MDRQTDQQKEHATQSVPTATSLANAAMWLYIKKAVHYDTKHFTTTVP